ncbi:hypothetical protein HS1genome_1638 [Sulfodiicoccus acidiphilus]|uniref:VapB-type antitoxin n=1 Tax=Sulfodiicoccus acidiphilus TaxID=1670455 RepID=A0A348B4Z7_9CREN|nr:hypothetical protein [Sulfodiicoccus acidiphilus]BBD73249.1 hypothetical protein HS1genome_1638 [Sulfodiicoccus acidiphilus]GGT89608.1 hypothetical protein GCM10007116_04320 [Sulfodiicoccus acidiphilus]
MPIITVRVDGDLKKRMEALPQINWSEVMRRAIIEEIERANGRDIATALLLNEKNRIKPEGRYDSTEEIRRWRSLLIPQ